jgi:hypothetical protein
MAKVQYGPSTTSHPVFRRPNPREPRDKSSPPQAAPRQRAQADLVALAQTLPPADPKVATRRFANKFSNFLAK